MKIAQNSKNPNRFASETQPLPKTQLLATSETSEFRLAVRQILCLTACLAVLWSSGGCLRKRMTINSNPPGATVYVDGHQLGKTPVSTDFTYYGTRNIRLEMDNYQTMVVKQKVTPPWYEFPPFDFFSETFSANEVKDHHMWTYDLQQRAISSDDQIMERANAFAFEGSRTVNSDGTLGTPVTAENYRARQYRSQVGTNPDAGFGTPIPINSGTTEALAVPAETSGTAESYPTGSPITDPNTQPANFNSPQNPGAPMPASGTNPNAFPTGSADWDSPNRYPSSN